MEIATVHLRLTPRECSVKPRPLETEETRLANAVAEATGVESAPSEPPGWAQSSADLGLSHGSINLSTLAIVA